MANARQAMKDQLKQRTQESYERREGGSDFRDYLDKEKVAGMPKWWAGKGEHVIDIIPYVAGDRDPKNKQGDVSYVLDLEVHRKVGAMDDDVVCPEQYGKPCPICEHKRALGRTDADWKTMIKPLKPSRRTLYNVIVRDNGKEEAKGNQLWEMAHWFMEKHLSKISRNPRTGGVTVFSDPDDGRSIVFERTGVGATDTGYDGHALIERPILKDSELEAAACLDSLIVIMDYDEIHTLFHTAPKTVEQEEPPIPEERQGQQDDGTDDGHPLEQHTAPEEQKSPAPRREQPAPETPAPPEANAPGTKRRKKCPHGGIIGKDIDEKPECENCAIYNDCADVADAM